MSPWLDCRSSASTRTRPPVSAAAAKKYEAFDASGSIGPWMVTTDELDPSRDLHLTTKVNGELRQDTTTKMMMLSFADLIAYVTRFMTLKPGDIISTGTPVGSGMGFDPPKWLKAGDTVEITVPEIGTLKNTVVAES